MRNIQCKRCFFFTPEWCPKKCDSLDPDLIRDCQYYRTKTNADRIRAMSDEELGHFLQCIEEKISVDAGFLGITGWLTWLKQEVTDDRT